jgi:phosphinothricin acetyltransferase
MAPLIRFALPCDAAGVLSIYAPFCESSHVSFEEVTPTVEQMHERITRVLTQYPWLVCESNGQLAGYVYASQHRERAAYRWAVDVAVYVAEGHRRRGVGRGLYTSLFSILREQGYHRVHAAITLPNEQSIGLHEAMGFRPIGVCPRVGHKLGRWLDVGWWQLSLQPERPEPAEPRAIGEIRHGDAVAAALAEGARLVKAAVVC